MLATPIPRINPDEFSRCQELERKTDHGKSLSPSQKADAAIKENISRAFRKDDVLRAIEYHEIDVHVKNGVVYLNGHIASMSSKSRIEKAMGTVSNIVGIQNELVLDDRLTLRVAASLGTLEHTYGCKFFTGVSHGVVSLNGVVGTENVKILAEKSAASHPNVRGVINNVRVAGAAQSLQDQPFLQPTIGENIYFLDGVSGIVKQVIINPNNRRVVGMTIWGQFANQPEIRSLNSGGDRVSEQLVALSMDLIRYLTKVSGFLNINSTERNRYRAFDFASFRIPNVDWTPPYPYCADDVLFPVEKQEMEYQILDPLAQPPVVVLLQEQVLWEQLAKENLGG